jgi:hypothetical protein
MHFSVGNFIRAIASVGLLATEPWITSKGDMLMASAVVIIVGTLDLLQMTKRNEMDVIISAKRS